MPYGGSYTARSPGELRTFSFDVAGDLAPGDTISSVTTTLASHPDAAADPNAATLLVGWPQIVAGKAGGGTVVAQKIGKNPLNAGGFAPKRLYAWTITAITEFGDTLIWVLIIPVGEI